MPTEFETRGSVEGDGALSLTGLPFPPGTRVEVVVRPLGPAGAEERYPLRGRPLRYDGPFDGVAAGDWDALRAGP